MKRFTIVSFFFLYQYNLLCKFKDLFEFKIKKLQLYFKFTFFKKVVINTCINKKSVLLYNYSKGILKVKINFQEESDEKNFMGFQTPND